MNHFLCNGATMTDPVVVDSGASYSPGISERQGTATTYLHSGLKNAFAQSGTSQTVTATREYDAFGNVMSPTGTWAEPFGYAVKFGYQSPSIPGVATPDTGITLMGHRYYDSSTGRFLTRDPIFDGRNWYSYGGGEGNPQTQADPNGLKKYTLSTLFGFLRAVQAGDWDTVILLLEIMSGVTIPQEVVDALSVLRPRKELKELTLVRVGKVQGLVANIAEHVKKAAEEPGSTAFQHWIGEIRNWAKQVADKLEKK